MLHDPAISMYLQAVKGVDPDQLAPQKSAELDLHQKPGY